MTKYVNLSPYNFTADNPILFKDVDGRDWFVNTRTGNVVFVNTAHEITASLVKTIGLKSPPSSYERLGPNEMFGDKVDIGGSDVLKMDYLILPTPQTFMSSKGYTLAKRVRVKETFTKESTGSFQGDNYGSSRYKIEQIGDDKLTYAKQEGLNKQKEVSNKSEAIPFVFINEDIYDVIIPQNQAICVTANWPDNKCENNTSTATNAIKITRMANDAALNEVEAGRAAAKAAKDAAAAKELAEAAKAVKIQKQ